MSANWEAPNGSIHVGTSPRRRRCGTFPVVVSTACGCLVTSQWRETGREFQPDCPVCLWVMRQQTRDDEGAA